MRTQRALILLLVPAAFLVLSATAAVASCAMPEGTLQQRLSQADIVFVGTVTSTMADGRVALVDVESVWNGDVETPATVIGGEVAQGVASSVDRSYRDGRRYLFTPYQRDEHGYRDNICTDTREWSNSLEELRPADATPASGPGDAPSDRSGEVVASQPGSRPGNERPWLPWVAAGIVLAACAGVLRAVRQVSG